MIDLESTLMTNYVDETVAVFESIIKPIEEESGLEFILIGNVGGDRISVDYINAVKGEFPNKIPIVFYGVPHISESDPTLNTGSFFHYTNGFDKSLYSYDRFNSDKRIVFKYIDYTKYIPDTEYDRDCVEDYFENSDVRFIYSPVNTILAATSDKVLYTCCNFSKQHILTEPAVFKLLEYTIGTYAQHISKDFVYKGYGGFDELTGGLLEQNLNSGVEALKRNATEDYMRAVESEKFARTSLLSALHEQHTAHLALERFKDVDDIRVQLEEAVKEDQIRWVTLEDKHLLFYIEDVTIYSEVWDVEKDIGDILVKVNLDTGNVVFNNLTRTVDGYVNGSNHPHDTDGGSMCLGNTSVIVAELIHNFQLAALVELLVNFAGSVNEDDPAGSKIELWPDV